MSRGRKILVWLALIVVGTYGLFAYVILPTATINYRLTLEAMTPDGPRTGSGVISIAVSRDINVNGGGWRASIGVTGEAVHLDLGQGKILFVTLTSQASGRERQSYELDRAYDATWLLFRVFGFSQDWGNEWALARQARAARAAGPREVPLVALPTTVTFRDLNDPKSVMLVDPRNIAASFGEGYALAKATMEITNDPPKEGIEMLLPWISRINGGYLHGGSTSDGSIQELSGLAFKSEGYSP